MLQAAGFCGNTGICRVDAHHPLFIFLLLLAISEQKRVLAR